MKKLLLLAMLAIVLVVSARAQQQGSVAEQSKDSCLVVWLKNGSQEKVKLDLTPNITYVGDSVMIETTETLKFAFKDIRKMTFIPRKQLKGDINGDNMVNMVDVNKIVSLILNGSYEEAADVNNDKVVNAADLVEVISAKTGNTASTDFIVENARKKGILTSVNDEAEDGNMQESIRFFLNTGQTVDMDPMKIGNITLTTKEQTVFYNGINRTFSIETIDSIWYISPVLKLTTESLDFGKVAVGNTRTLTAMLTNTSNFMESYMMLGGGPFSVQASAKEIMILPGESRSIELTFTPTDSIAYSGLFSIASNAIDGGMVYMPLNGEGVAADSLETDVVTPPVEVTFDIMLQDDEQIEDFTGFKIVNFNGEYELDVPTMARKMRRAKRVGETYNVASTNALISSAGLQLHNFTDALGNPVMYTISLPGEKPIFSFRETGFALLLSTPYLAPANVSDYKNTVSVLKKLKSFDVYVYNLRQEYNDAKRNNRAPDYSKVSMVDVINELYNMIKDNRQLMLSGVSLKDLNVTPELATFKLHNDFKRSLVMFASRLKMNESNLLVTDQEKISPTYIEVLNKLTEYLVKLENQEFKDNKDDFIDVEDKVAFAISETLFQDLIKLFENDPSYHMEMPIWLPYIMDSGKSSYWDIVWNARWDMYWKTTWNSAVGMISGDGIDLEGARAYMQSNDASIFAKDKDMSFEFKDYDKIQLDIYGMGVSSETNWNSLSLADCGILLLAMTYGGYFDFVKPLMKLMTGYDDVSKRIMAEGSTLDLRHGTQKVWVHNLLIKLLWEFFKKPDNWTKLHDKLEKSNYAGAGIVILKFMGEEMSKLPEEAKTPYEGEDNQCTYINMLYHIAKTSFGVSTTPKAFRQFFKAGGKALLELIGLVLETVDVCEAVMDLSGGVYAMVESKPKETFIINKYDQPHITPKEPIKVYDTVDADIHFSWDLNVGNNYGTNYLYDLEMAVETLSEVTRTMVLTNLTETECNYNLSKLPNAKSARKILYRIIAHHPDNPAGIYVMTDFIQLFQNPNVSDVVTPEMVDLGLPSGTKWAVCNLGATSASDYGNYYAWGETDTKTSFSWKNYKYSGNTSNSLTKYCTKSSYGKVDNKIQLEPADDRIKTDYGYYWSIPTKEDWQELMTHCTWSRFGNDFMVRGPNGSIILLPSAGYKDGLNTYDSGTEGYYWSLSVDEGSPDDAWFVHIKNGKPEFYSYYRYQGRCIRPVQHKANYGPPSTVK